MSDSICRAWAEPEDLPCDLAALLPEGDDPPAPEVVEEWLWFASSILYSLSGSRWRGECSAEVRPCGEARRASAGRSWWPGERAGTVAACSCSARGLCGCESASLVDLGRGVLGVDMVIVDGVALDPSEYELIDGRFLAGREGRVWPCCQDMTIPAGEPGSWSVALRFGEDPPRAGKIAAAALACEFVKGSLGLPCQLPKRATSVSRQGVSVTVGIDPLQLFAEGGTGVDVVDMWLSSLRIENRRRPGRLIPAGRRRRGVRADRSNEPPGTNIYGWSR